MNAVFLKLLNMGIAAGWLVLAAALLRFALKKAPKWIACLLWAIVAVRLICPVSPESRFSLIPSAETVPANIESERRPEVHTGVPAVNSAVNPVLERAGSLLAPDDAAKAERPMQTAVDVLSAAWLAGAGVMLIYAAASYLRMRKKVGASICLRDNIYVCDDISSPFILGIFKPRIYLPSGMNEDAAEHVIRHEQTHLRRHDHLWKPLGYILLAAYWYNPLIWLAYILLCRDIELACDERVVRDMDREGRAAYSQTLLDCGSRRAAVLACPLAFGEVGVKERVRSVLNYKKPAFWLIIAAAALCTVLAVCFLTNPYSIKSLPEGMKAAMDESVIENNGRSNVPPGEDRYRAVDYELLRIKRSGEKTTVYAWVFYEEYVFENGKVRLDCGSHIPTVITLAKDEAAEHGYAVEEYWIPRDGTYYAEDIRAKFPRTLWSRALKWQKNIDQMKKENLAMAEEYFFAIAAKEGELETLRERYPEYFDLSTAKGLEVYVWQMAPGSYSCGVLPGTNREKTTTELWGLKSASIEDMKAILSTYDIPKSDIIIIPFYMPYSSYAYTIDDDYAKGLYRLFGLEAEPAETVSVVSGERSIEAVEFFPLTVIQDLSLQPLPLLKIDTSSESLTPFDVLRDGDRIYGWYNIYDAETLEPLDFFRPSGLEPQTYLFRNAEKGREYIITMRTSGDGGEEVLYCFKAMLI